jgi:hypothetical protein
VPLRRHAVHLVTGALLRMIMPESMGELIGVEPFQANGKARALELLIHQVDMNSTSSNCWK